MHLDWLFLSILLVIYLYYSHSHMYLTHSKFFVMVSAFVRFYPLITVYNYSAIVYDSLYICLDFLLSARRLYLTIRYVESLEQKTSYIYI